MDKKIGLYNLEPKINNSAMMQVSYYHKQQLDKVEIYNPKKHETYDKIYAFSLFDFTPKDKVTPDMITGGTGFNIKTRLPPEIENSNLDYSIFPKCKYSIIWFSRGCFRKCPFCVVHEKEGNIHPVKPKNLNPKGTYIKVMDNNFFANPNWRWAVKTLIRARQPIDMQGFDIRIFNEEQGEAIQKLKHKKAFKFAWDNPKQNIDDKIELLLNYMKPYKLMCYVLIGYWSTPEEDLYRVNHLQEEYNIEPYIMPYNTTDTYQKLFRNYVNGKKIFHKTTWKEYLKDKQNYHKTELTNINQIIKEYNTINHKKPKQINTTNNKK